MDDDTGHQKQRRLVTRMGHQENNGRLNRSRRPDAQQHDHETQRRDRGVSQQPLEIDLRRGHQRTGQQGQHTHHRQPPGPGFGTTQRRTQPGQQVHARLDHRGRVQIGTGRRRRLHGVGQPEMERRLGRFGERTDQDQTEDHRIVCVRSQDAAGTHDFGE